MLPKPPQDRRSLLETALGLGLILAASIPSVHAASDIWDGSTDATWAAGTNWALDPAIAPGTVDSATFNSAGNGFTTIDLGAGVTIGALLFDTASAGAYTIGSGAVGSQTLTLGTVGNAITVNSTVASNQVVNANIALATTGAYTFTNNSANSLTLAGGISSSTAGVKTLTVTGTGNTLFGGTLANGTGTTALTKSGAGTLTLSGTGNALGGTLQINAGILDLNSDLGLANATLINGTGGTINATGGGKLLLNVALGDIGTANGGTLTINSIIANGTQDSVDFWHTGSGTGVVALTADNTWTGSTNLQSGIVSVAKIGNGGVAGNLGTNATLSIGAATSTATLRYTGTGETNNRVINLAGTTGGAIIEQAGTGLLKFTSNLTGTIGGNKALTLTGSTAGTGEFAGNIVNAVTGATTLVKTGTGTWTISGAANSYSGGTRVNQGTMVISGALTGNGFLSVNNVGAQNAVLKIVTGANIAAFDMPLAEATNSRGAVYQSGGTLALSRPANTSAFKIGGGIGSYGYYNLSGGTLSANEVGIGGLANDSTGVMDVSSSGQFNVNGWITIGRGGLGSSGVLNATGGTVTATRIHLNWAGSSGATSILNVGGGAGAAAVSTTGSTTLGLDLANTATAGTIGVANLLTNGTLTTGLVTAGQANPTALLNFHGGTLKATATNAGANFLTSANIDAVTVYSGGGTIDNNGTNITVGRPLLAATGKGVTTIAITDGGSGYIGAPLVKITGGTGNGATAVANMVDDGTGNGTFKVGSITITSPGTYTVDPTGISLTGGGAATAASGFAISTLANTSGGMTFNGAGGTTGTTLSGASTYTGATQINGTVTVGVASVADVSGALGNNSAVALANSANASLGLNNFDTRIGALAGGGATGGNVTLGTATLTTGGANKSGSYAGAISGSGGLTKVGTGAQTLTGINTYTGATQVNAGTLIVGVSGSGSITSNVTVAGGATLGGSGTIAGNITLAAESSSGAKDGGILAAGNSPGVLTATGTTTLNAGSIFSWELASNLDGDAVDAGDTGTRGTHYDGLSSGGLSVASGAVFRVLLSGTADLGDSFWTQSQRWTDIFNVSGTTTGASLGSLFDSFEVYDGSTNITTSSASYGGFGFDGTTLTWSAVPEPGAAWAGLLVAAGLLRRRRGL